MFPCLIHWCLFALNLCVTGRCVHPYKHLNLKLFFCICSNTCTLFIPELTADHPYNIHTLHQTFFFSQSHGTPKCSHQGKANACGQVIQAVGCIIKFEAQFHETKSIWMTFQTFSDVILLHQSINVFFWVGCPCSQVLEDIFNAC